MTANRLVLRGTELRYALTMHLFRHGPQSVAQLIDSLDWQGFSVEGRPSKAVSDALRWERRRERVRRLGRARYGPGVMPRATEHRMRRRLSHLRAQAAVLSAADDAAFWDAVLGPLAEDAAEDAAED